MPQAHAKVAKALVVAVVLISWAPTTGAWQLLAYVGPVLVVVAALLTGTARISVLDLLFVSLIGLVFFVSGAFHTDTGLMHPALGLLTYSSILLLIIRFKADGTFLVHTLAWTIAWVTSIEALYGTFQLLSYQRGFVFSNMSAGDWVVGTLGTNSHLYAVKMLFQGTLLLALWKPAQCVGLPKARFILIAAIAGLVAALLASAIAATILFAVTLLIWASWRFFKRVVSANKTDRLRVPRATFRAVAAATFAATLLGAFFYLTQPRNSALVARTLPSLLTLDFSDRIRFQKIITFRKSISEVLLDNDKNVLLGLGLGRYSSRAAMILSGGYLREQPSWIPVSRSAETERHIYSVWNREIWHIYGGSIMGMPTNSFQSVLIEGGIFGSAALLAYFWLLASRASQAVKRVKNPLHMRLCQMVPPLLLSLLALSATDLWLEYSSFVSVLYLCVMVALSRPTAIASQPA